MFQSYFGVFQAVLEFSVSPSSERARVKCCGWGCDGGREVYSLSLDLSNHLPCKCSCVVEWMVVGVGVGDGV